MCELTVIVHDEILHLLPTCSNGCNCHAHALDGLETFAIYSCSCSCHVAAASAFSRGPVGAVGAIAPWRFLPDGLAIVLSHCQWTESHDHDRYLIK